MRRSRILLTTLGALGALAAPARAGAQEVEDTLPRPPALSAGGRLLCDGRLVTSIDIRANGPPLGGIFRRSRVLANTVRALHVNTREGVIRRFLVLEVGDRCSELRRAESERLLRAQPYLADARVVPYEDGQGGVRLEVTTWDELALIGGVGVRTPGPEVGALKLGSANLAGDAMHVVAEWRDGRFYRDEVGGRITDYQFLGRPYQVTLEGSRQSLGQWWLADVSHPYFTDLQRIAWRASAGAQAAHARFRRAGDGGGALAISTHFWDVGGIMRLGLPGRLSLFGASLSGEATRVGAAPVTITDTGVFALADTVAQRTLANRYAPHHSARVNFLWGVRNVRFVRVTGFDALSAPQDIRVGFQFGTLLGRSLPAIGSDDDDVFLAADVYLANGSRKSFLALQARGEGRQDGDREQWDDVLTSGRLAWYFRPTDWHTLVTSAEWGAGWRSRAPFQLSLADDEGGVRGFRDSEKAGSQRAVVRVEQRFRFGTVKQLADAGLAVFVDGGRLWAGDAPYGVDTRPSYGAGVGLLAAVPPRSRRLWRVDVAWPLTNDPDASWVLSISSRDRTRTFYREPTDVRAGRERSVPSSVFNWP